MKALLLLVILAGIPVEAQWLDHPDPSIPRNEDGSPNLEAPTPIQDGRPDLSGLWEMERTNSEEWNRFGGAGFTDIQIDLYDISAHAVNVHWGAYAPGQEPFTEAGARAFQQNVAAGMSTQAQCLPSSIPLDLFTFLFKIIPTPREVLMLTEWDDPARQIFTDGRSLPEDPSPAWMGYSVGSWDDDTFVVETIGFTDRAWLDLMSHPRSEAMRVTERYHRRDFGHMDVEIRMEDPVYYTEPILIRTSAHLIPDSELLEFVCNENEKDQDQQSP